MLMDISIFCSKGPGRGGNRTGQVGFGFGSGQFDLLEEIGSGRVRSGSGRVGSIYILYFFRSLIDFDWIKSHLILGRVGFGSGRICLTFLKNQIGSGSDPDGSDGFLESDRVLPPLGPGRSYHLIIVVVMNFN
jgi:hypothetical protein